MNRWDGIDEVVAVADSGSFAKAARMLGVSTSHVSRAVARIETRLAVPIFARTTRIVSPTDAGRELIAQFRQLVVARDEMIASIDQGPEPQGHLRLTCSVGLGLHFVTPILLDYMRDYPRVQVQYDLTDRIVDVVGEGYDVAIRTGNLPDSRPGDRPPLVRAPVAGIQRDAPANQPDSERLMGSIWLQRLLNKRHKRLCMGVYDPLGLP